MSIRRTRPVNRNGIPVFTPALPRTVDANLKCQRCRDKEEHIARLEARIETLQQMVNDKEEFVVRQQKFIDKLKDFIALESKPLMPSPTTRPARRGNL